MERTKSLLGSVDDLPAIVSPIEFNFILHPIKVYVNPHLDLFSYLLHLGASCAIMNYLLFERYVL